jgi:N-acetylglucosaminyldiphosphoundecaprenol N-acetyl-beta-D-mannosaminyltransferase
MSQGTRQEYIRSSAVGKTPQNHESAFEKDAIHILGVCLHPLTVIQLNEVISDALAEDRRLVIGNHNLHSVYLFHRDMKFRSFYDISYLNHIDGMSLIVWSKIMGYHVTRENRISYLDWIFSLMALAAKNQWRVFYLGALPGVAEQGAKILKNKISNLMLASASGYFEMQQGSPDNERILNQINDFNPQLLLVGMGMPRQEYWILENQKRLHAHVILNCGACIDYIAGAVPTPPRWTGRWGVEWLYRLMCEPFRLWKRCLWEPWFLLRLCWHDIKNARRNTGKG